ncbi:hypothetical protein J6590_105099 [Homalodisca vitripennis]|nr:hypothetical protein J6590_105099 [Homalodisca vitripennis]
MLNICLSLRSAIGRVILDTSKTALDRELSEGAKYLVLLGTGSTKMQESPRKQDLKQTERCHNFGLPKTDNYRRSGRSQRMKDLRG